MKKGLLKATIFAVVLSLPLILQSANKTQAAVAVPFGKCGAAILAFEDGYPTTNCIYHFFRCECQIIRN